MKTTRYLFFPNRWALGALLWLSMLAGAARAQAPGWQAALSLAQSAGGESLTTAVATGPEGEVYVAGYFELSLTLGNTTLTSVGGHDIFVAKWSPNSNSFVWAVQAGGTDLDTAYGLAVEGPNVYVTGYYSYVAATFGTTQLPSYGNSDAFVAKLVDTGAAATWAWAQHMGGVGNDRATGVAVLGTSVYVAGTYILAGTTSQATFGTIQLPTLGGYNGYVTKLTDAGTAATFMWARAMSGTVGAQATALAATATGVYVGGDITYGTVTFGTQQLTSAGNSDGFVAKLLDGGTAATWAWATRLGGTDYEHVQAVAVSGTSVYVGGEYSSPTLALGTLTLPHAGNGDGFMAKLTDAGSSATFTWAKQVGSTYSDAVRALVARGTSLYLTGYISGPAVAFGNTTLNGGPSYQTFLARLTDLGTSATYAWALASGGTAYTPAYALAMSSTADFYLGGELRGTATFGSSSITGIPMHANAFVAWAHEGSLLATARSAALAGLTLYPNPAHSPVTVQLPAGLPAGPATLTVLDALGRVVRTRTASFAPSTSTTELDVAGLAPGVYALRVAVGKSVGTVRLAVE